MQLIRKLALGVATLSVALGAGHLVQSGPNARFDRITVAGASLGLRPIGAAATARPAAHEAALRFPSTQHAVSRSLAASSPVPGSPAAKWHTVKSPAIKPAPESIVLLAAVMTRTPGLPVRAVGEPPAVIAALLSDMADAASARATAETTPTAASLVRQSPQPALPALPPAVLAAVEADKLARGAAASPPPADSQLCGPDLSIWPQTGAMLAVALILPCAKDAPVVLRHGGLALSARTGADGVLRLSLPAMEPTGRVAVTLPDGEVMTREAPLTLSGLQRVAVQWLDADAMHLQVFEDGAAFGTPGHVSATQPKGAGSLVRLGSRDGGLPMMSEVYTYPAAPIRLDVSVEAEVTAATCGREILGQLLASRDGEVTTTDLTLQMPGCEAMGDFLVLNNLVGDTTLAQAE